MNSPPPLALVLTSHDFTWDALQAKKIYLKSIELFEKLDGPPEKIGGKGAFLPSKYSNFEKYQTRLSNCSFEDISSLEIISFNDPCSSELTQWRLNAGIHMGRHSSHARFGVNFGEIHSMPMNIAEHIQSLQRQIDSNYAYMFLQNTRMAPTLYALGMGFGNIRNERHPDYRMNISWWGHTATGDASEKTFSSGILRDVYLQNFLSRRYLDAPVGGTLATLREWIEADAERGTIKPFTDKFWLWEPVVENIPTIREQLYRAGRVFYWRFFDSSDPLYRRDLTEPWEATGETPEVFSAAFYADKDPGLIY